MKTLKEYLTEGIFDVEDNIERLSVESLIEDFIKENYNIFDEITINKVKDKYIISTKGIVRVKNKNITELTNNGLFEWDEIEGSFHCDNCTSLKDLKGAPKNVGGDFVCDNCTSLESLTGAPKKVGGVFTCINCTSLKDLKGAPEKVKYNFYCDNCTSLKDLKGAPKNVGGIFTCDGCKSLKDLKGAPKNVGNGFFCRNCGKKFTKEDIKKVCDVKGKIII